MKKNLLLGSFVILIAASVANSSTTPSTARQLLTTTKIERAASNNKEENGVAVKLLNSGNQPRQELRFRPPVNSKQKAKMDLDLDILMSVNGETKPKYDLPIARLELESQVTRVDPNGDIRGSISALDTEIVDKKNARPEVVTFLQFLSKQMVGSKGTFVMDNRGNLQDVDLALPEKLAPFAKQLQTQVSDYLKQQTYLLFPDSAIGVGAKWQTTNLLMLGKVKLNQSVTYELVEAKNNFITLKVTSNQQGAAQELTLPANLKNMSARIISLNNQSKSTIKMNLNKILPADLVFALDSETNMKFTRENTKKESLVKTNSSMKFNLASQ